MAGLLIDLTVDGQNHYELKLKRAVDYRDIGEYLAKYFDEIIANRERETNLVAGIFCRASRS